MTAGRHSAGGGLLACPVALQQASAKLCVMHLGSTGDGPSVECTGATAILCMTDRCFSRTACSDQHCLLRRLGCSGDASSATTASTAGGVAKQQDEILALLQRHVPGAEALSAAGAEVAFRLPKADAAKCAHRQAHLPVAQKPILVPVSHAWYRILLSSSRSHDQAFSEDQLNLGSEVYHTYLPS